jgi:HlyD family secretion protein
MRQKLFMIIALVLLVSLGASGCGVTKTKRTLTLNGKLENPVTAITAPRDGKVLGLILEKGDRIRKDEPLFAITRKGEDAGVEKATAELARAQAELKNAKGGASAAQIGAATGAVASAEASVSQAQQIYDKMARLYSIGGVAKNKLDQSQANLNAARENYAATQAHLRQLQTRATPEAVTDLEGKVQKLKAAYDAEVKNQTTNEVHAPSTCQVIEILVKNGAEASVGQNIMNVRSLTNCTVTAGVTGIPSTAALKPGLPVQLSVKGSPKTFTGAITAVKDGTVTITSTNKPEDLQDGASVIVTIAIE